MTTSNSGRSGTFNTPAAAPVAPDAWEATRAQTALATQLQRDEEDYLANGNSDIGRQVGANVRELFVSCAPDQAMRQQFEHLHPEFIAVHDIGGASSKKLLTGLAAASGRAMQKLIIRRQGYGTSLATLEFVELATAVGTMLRVYTTEVEADTASRHGLARTLLAFSRLGVVMVGDLPAHSIASALKPLHDDMVTGFWHNRHMLLLPLTSVGNLASQGVEMSRGTGVTVRTTPQVARPADAWAFIEATWARLRDPTPPPGHGATTPAGAAMPRHVAAAAAPRPMDSAPLTMRPMPHLTSAAGKAAAPARENLLNLYVHRLSELTGMVSCCVFDIAAGREMHHAGASPGAADLAMHGAELLASMTATSRTLGLGHALPEAAITLGAHHLLLRAVPKHPGLALHAVLDKTHANLTLARLQVLRLDSVFDDPDQ
jgi:hypothetical protein